MLKLCFVCDVSSVERIPVSHSCGNTGIDKFLQSHFQKKNSVNTMGESNIPMHAIIFRYGWEKNSVHTIFNYLFTSLSNNMRCGKTLAYCLFKQSNEIYGGTPPSLDDIKIEP